MTTPTLHRLTEIPSHEEACALLGERGDLIGATEGGHLYAINFDGDAADPDFNKAASELTFNQYAICGPAIYVAPSPS